ncbi:hypothetical protein GCM10020369_05710 [Cryptosporangium minutisporangium]|uniref:Uncharacterized protein n=1 Tax=Cryptosporangium minutisporangium TaxID=113569 RepID=A0ABP6SQ81_9ACTN
MRQREEDDVVALEDLEGRGAEHDVGEGGEVGVVFADGGAGAGGGGQGAEFDVGVGEEEAEEFSTCVSAGTSYRRPHTHHALRSLHLRMSMHVVGFLCNRDRGHGVR